MGVLDSVIAYKRMEQENMLAEQKVLQNVINAQQERQIRLDNIARQNAFLDEAKKSGAVVTGIRSDGSPILSDIDDIMSKRELTESQIERNKAQAERYKQYPNQKYPSQFDIAKEARQRVKDAINQNSAIAFDDEGNSMYDKLLADETARLIAEYGAPTKVDEEKSQLSTKPVYKPKETTIDDKLKEKFTPEQIAEYKKRRGL